MDVRSAAPVDPAGLEAILAPDAPGRMLPAEAYTSEAVLAWERQHLFADSWVCAGRSADLADAGDRRALRVGDDSVVLVRGDDGVLRGFYNVCRHRGHQLQPEDTTIRRNAIHCPYHAWTYGLDGRLKRAPFVDDVDVDAFGLHPVGVDTWGGWVFVHLTPEAASPLAEQLGPVPERVQRYPLADLRRGDQVVYDVAANWKVIAENFNECYHCGPVHPELCDLVPAFRGGRDLDWEGGVPHREGAWTFTETGISDRAPFPDLDDDERVRHKGELIYPNVLLSLAAEHAAALVLTPLGPARTRVVGEFLFARDEITGPGFDPSDAVTFWDRINRQDWLACERVQRGMGSRAYTHGWFAPMEDDSADIRLWYGGLMGQDG
jgi:Rieske 2Fe-2S family protein